MTAPDYHWPPDDVDLLKIWWAEGWSCGEISLSFGGKYSRNAVIGKANRLKLEPRAADVNRAWNATRRMKRPAILAYYRETRAKDGEVAKDITHLANEPAPIGPIADFPKTGCRWPRGTGQTFQCCGHPSNGKGPYCEYHAAKAYAKPHPGRPRANGIAGRF